MFPLPISFYIYAGIALISAFGGFYVEHLRFQNYKQEVKIEAEKQIAKNIEIVKEQALINKGISNEYEAKLAAIKSYYGGLRQPGSGSMPSLSNPSSGTNVPSSQLLLDCAISTQQVISLQNWIKEQAGL